MSTATAAEPQVLHALAGRVRVHLPGWAGGGSRRIEKRLRQLPGVRKARANPLTGNVLVEFDPGATDQQTVLDSLHGAGTEAQEVPPKEEAPPPPVIHEKEDNLHRARIAVRGLDRSPHLAREVVDRLQRVPGVVRATASQLTGRVHVEFESHRVELEELLCEVMDVELPPLPDEDRPAHPLDPAPLLQSTTRAVGAALGLALVAFRQLTGRAPPLTVRKRFATTAGVTALLQGFPAIRGGVRKLLGRDVADVSFSSVSILSNALAGSPLNLLLSGAEALRLLTEVVARRAAWRHYEARIGPTSTVPGAVIRLEAGDRVPRMAVVVEGTGTAVGPDGIPVPVAPGGRVGGGARLAGGPFVLELEAGEAFVPEPRPAPPAPTLFTRYLHALGPASLAYAGLTALTTWSLSRTFQALLLVNPRAAVIGADTANLSAAARALRAGVTVVGTRPDRPVRLPDVLLLDGPHLLTDGLEVLRALPLTEAAEPSEVLALAAGVAAASGSPWGRAFPRVAHGSATDGSFDGSTATAAVGGVRYALGPAGDAGLPPVADRLHEQGDYLLLLRREGEGQPLGVLALRPRLAEGATELVHACRRHGVELVLFARVESPAARALARRVGVPLLAGNSATAVVRERQQDGALVALVSDSAHAARAFAACDLAIGLAGGRSTRVPARADLLAPDLTAVAAVVEAGALRERAVRDGVGLSLLGNLAGAAWGLLEPPGIHRATIPMTAAALAALVDAWARLRGGQRPGSSLAYLGDPRPERWGRRSVESVLRSFHTTEAGLSSARAAERRRHTAPAARSHELLTAVLDQLRYPTTTILAAGAGVALLVGDPLDAAIIGATIAVNVAVGAWQERQASRTAEALERLGTATARVLRDGRPVTVAAKEVVPGDVLLLAPGDRVAADARLLSAQGLEVDEAALTGESLPVRKAADAAADDGRVVLEGSDVVVGAGRAVVVAVGRSTRLGATAAALAHEETAQSPLGLRLGRMLQQSLPLAAGGGALAVAAGLVRGRPLLPQLAVGASIALAVVPEGLPLLAGVGEAAIARRLAARNAVVHRLGAVEALGRVDVVCTDKTGTLTEGRLSLRLVADGEREAALPGPLPEGLRRVLLTAALASPHPDAADAAAHPTDVAVVRAAREAGLEGEVRAPRAAEASFDPARAFHASVAGGRLCVKGAPETLAARCSRVRRPGGDRPLGEAGRQALLARARHLAEQGLRVLMVAEGPPEASVHDPRGLAALGFVGIRDPLRPGVHDSVRRCRQAGVRVIMLTGDHPATARAIAREAGLLGRDDELLTGAEIAELSNGDLDRRLDRATVIARATPLDKLRIVECLQRLGHTVAMTGDGVNDAPALRLADVGVAMGRAGTEVARQAADVVLGDDDFATLVETFVEGRGFWQNMRRALGLLLGGNLGELGLIVGASALGFASPLNTRQILTVNLITDALPALSVVLQRPGERDLSALAREGTAALDATVRREVYRRGFATAAPALAAYLLARGAGTAPQASGVAFAGIVANQLAQTLDAGRVEGSLSPSVVKAVAGSGAILLGTFTVPSLRNLLGLAMPSPFGWALVGGGALGALLLSRALPGSRPALPNGAHPSGATNGATTPGVFPFPLRLPDLRARPANL